MRKLRRRDVGPGPSFANRSNKRPRLQGCDIRLRRESGASGTSPEIFALHLPDLMDGLGNRSGIPTGPVRCCNPGPHPLGQAERTRLQSIGVARFGASLLARATEAHPPNAAAGGSDPRAADDEPEWSVSGISIGFGLVRPTDRRRRDFRADGAGMRQGAPVKGCPGGRSPGVLR